ncbi:MAG: hypothetical protein ACXWAT_00230 [Methylobacter sp.]
MARDKRVSVNVEDELDDFVKRVAKKNHVSPATMYYILLRDQAESIGFDIDEFHEANVPNRLSV